MIWSARFSAFHESNPRLPPHSLPIIQGSSFTFLVPIIAIMSLPQWECPDPETIANLTVSEADELWMPRIREVGPNSVRIILFKDSDFLVRYLVL